MNSNNKKTNRGFTIVELLVVIVVIGILAAITIVSYSGITNRANKAAAQSAAANLQGKVEMYFAETETYPATVAALASDPTKTYYLSGITHEAMGAVTSNVTVPAASPTAPTKKDAVLYAVCGVQTAGTDTAPSTLAQIVTRTGIKIYYWDWSSNGISTAITSGTVSGTKGTQNIACATSA